MTRRFGFGKEQVKVIWKYEINPMTKLEMPQGARILAIQVQDNQPQLWALVDPAQPKVHRYFRSMPTGVEFDDAGLTYIGTFQINQGSLVFHLFEETP